MLRLRKTIDTLQKGHWSAIDKILNKALEVPEEERKAYIKYASKGDAELEKEVYSLLEAIDSSQKEHFLESSSTQNSTFIRNITLEHITDRFVGKKIGAFELTEQIGYGGMSLVFMAERVDGEFKQKVAIKLIRGGLHSSQILKRFKMEKQILASLNHPNIARLFDGGITDDGNPYLIMELIEGKPVDQYCNDNKLTVNQRLTLFKKACNAVTYAHNNLIVHRDLKAQNILVTKEGNVKILDFGIAKLLDVSPEETLLTRPGQQLWTPQYASPEQVNGQTITTATDVYSLGILLHKLLTNRFPYDISNKSNTQIYNTIIGKEPETLGESLKRVDSLEKLTEERGTTVHRLKKKLDKDLEAITIKSLQKKVSNRYNTVAKLVQDIEHYESDIPIEARKKNKIYAFKKFSIRHIKAISFAAIALIIFIGITVFYTDQLTKQRQEALHAAEKAQAIMKFTVSLFEQADPYSANNNKKAAAALTLLKPASHRVLNELDGQPEIQAAMLHSLGILYHKLGRVDMARPMMQRAMAIQQSVYGPINKDIATTLHDYGIMMITLNADSSAVYFKKAAQIRRELYDSDHPDLAESLLQWARFLPYGNPKKQRLFDEAINMYRRLYGQRSVEVAEAIYEYYLLGYGNPDDDVIIAAFRKVLSIKRERLGEMNLNTAQTMHDLGLTLDSIGKDEKGLALLQKSYEIGLKVSGLRNKLVRKMGINVAATLHERGYYEAADSIIVNILPVIRETLPDSSQGLGYILYWHGRNLTAMQRFDVAEKTLRKSLSIYRKVLKNDRKVWRIQGELGHCLAKQGRYQEAEQELLNSYKSLSDYSSINDPFLQITIGYLVRLYEHWNKPKKANYYSNLMQQNS